MKCIFCDIENEAKSIEHIVSESFGNKRYLMARSTVCDSCNNKFSSFESKALSSTVFVMERARWGIETKKGKNAKGKVGELEIEGHPGFQQQRITVKGLSEKNLIDFNPQKGTYHLVVKSFDKSESATAKFLLKVALESIYTSQKALFERYSFQEVKDYLSGKHNDDWPFVTTDVEAMPFQSVPRFQDKYVLKKEHCLLRYLEVDENTLLFKFKFGGIPMTINILSRDFSWIKSLLKTEEDPAIYPEHFRRKLGLQKLTN